MKNILHAIAHFLGWHYGDVVSFEHDRHFYVGFKCATCGRVEDIVCMDGMIEELQKEIEIRRLSGFKTPSPEVAK